MKSGSQFQVRPVVFARYLVARLALQRELELVRS
jgi:hypothetical protein